MADPHGFTRHHRQEADRRKVEIRLSDYKEIYEPTTPALIHEQAARCMSCGVPFCHSGCPLGNKIPDFNDAVHQGQWQRAYHILSETNNFPEFTGRICPAPCEASCVLGLYSEAVTIEQIEKKIIEAAFEHGWVQPNAKANKKNKKIAVIGSGPSGLATTDQLCALGYAVDVYEKSDAIGGLLRYGIPDFKLEKWVIDRRIKIMESAGVQFFTNCDIGIDIDIQYLKSNYDAIAICIGAGVPRDIAIEGRDANGIYFAMEFLTVSNKYVSRGKMGRPDIDVKGKNVVVIGGGDTGADCVGTSHRQGAASVTQLEVMFKPPTSRSASDPWPRWPMILRTSSSHEEGGHREWAVLTKAFLQDEDNHLIGIKTINVEWEMDANTHQHSFKEVPGSEKIIPCEAAFIAVGFLHAHHHPFTNVLDLQLDERQNIFTTNHQTSIPEIYAAGDARRGQSLVVWAIAEGRACAEAIDKSLSVQSLDEVLVTSYKM